MKRITSIVKVSEQGVSRPFLCTDEDGGVRWCKGSHTGFRSLIAAFQNRVRGLIRGDFLECAWNEMPSAWTEVGEDVLPIGFVRNVTSEE